MEQTCILLFYHAILESILKYGITTCYGNPIQPTSTHSSPRILTFTLWQKIQSS